MRVNVVRFKGRVAAVKQAGAYGFLEHDDDTVPAAAVGATAAAAAGVEAPGAGVGSGTAAVAGAAAAAGEGGADEAAGESGDTSKSSAADDGAAGAGAGSGATRHAHAGKQRVFFHGSEVENGVTLKEHDEVEYSVTLHHESVRAMHKGGGGGGGGKEPGGSGGVKEPSARRIVRTKAGGSLRTSTRPTVNLLLPSMLRSRFECSF